MSAIRVAAHKDSTTLPSKLTFMPCACVKGYRFLNLFDDDIIIIIIIIIIIVVAFPAVYLFSN